MPAYAYGILAAGWLIWVLPFFLIKRNSGKPDKLDRRARWGIVLQAIAFAILWRTKFWGRPPEYWRTAFSVLFFVAAAVLSWNGARTLGRQWRIDAGLNPDHELVRSGVYGVIRHPIYTSMLSLLLGMGFMNTPLLMILVSTSLCLIGLEVRVRIEDGLLASRFGDQFRDYQRSVPAYIPFLR